ncbi:hypothetical protein JCM6882_005801 [Rhodosporidiobolus microsporus]
MTLRPDSKHCLAFPGAPIGLDAWVEAEGEPAAVSEKRKNDKKASGTVKVHAGARLCFRYGDFRQERPAHSYVTGFAVDGTDDCSLITSKSDSFWRKPLNHESRVGTALDPKTGGTLSRILPSGSLSSLRVTVKLRTAYDLIDEEDQPYSTVELRVVVDPAPTAVPPPAASSRSTARKKAKAPKASSSKPSTSTGSRSTRSPLPAKTVTAATAPPAPFSFTSSASSQSASSHLIPLKKLSTIAALSSASDDDRDGDTSDAELEALEREKETVEAELRELELKKRKAQLEEKISEKKRRRGK